MAKHMPSTGQDGAGKTTMIRILTGFQTPTAGSCRVLGLDPAHRDQALELRKRVGYVSDAPALYDWMSIGEIGWFTASFFPAGFTERYREMIDRYDLPVGRKIKQLSKGQRSKVAFLESMITVAAAGRTVFLSSHQIAEIERVAD